jgi:hypothetical protein
LTPMPLRLARLWNSSFAGKREKVIKVGREGHSIQGVEPCREKTFLLLTQKAGC